MDPETQRLFTVALIGLLLFFPVFNQVAQTAVDSLRDADHKAQMQDFFKNWDDIPDDRKLEYWDGRNPPPGHWNDERHHDARIRDPNGSGGNGGGPNGTEGEDPDEVEPEYEQVTETIWSFTGTGTARQDRVNLPQRDYQTVNITWSYAQFTGEAEFTLYVGEQVRWSDIRLGSNGVPTFMNTNEGQRGYDDIGNTPMTIEYTYDPTMAPAGFEITITGTYLVEIQ
jgi:hypothetical protein